MVTLLNSTVAGLHIRFGATSASSVVNPSLLFVRQFANAVSAALPRGPIMRSMCATSLPSPTSDSPTHSPLIFAMPSPPKETLHLHRSPSYGSRPNGYPCCQRPKLGPVSQIAAEVFRKRKSITVARRRQDAPQSMREKSRHSQVRACPRIDVGLL